MLKKSILSIFVILSISFSLSAQKNVDGGATPILEKISSAYQAFSTMQIDFTLKVEKEKEVLSSEKGKMTTKGEKYNLSFGGQDFYCDGSTIWNYQSATNEISIFENESDDENLLNPMSLLKGWQKSFQAKYIRDEFENNKSIILIDLTPIKVQSYHKIRLFIDKPKDEIIRIAMFEKDNTLYTYYFDKFIKNSPIEDSKFQLDTNKYPDAEINDMR